MQHEYGFYDDNTIGKFKQGAVVMDIDTERIGHVVKFGINAANEVVVLVAFANDHKNNYYMNPYRLKVLS